MFKCKFSRGTAAKPGAMFFLKSIMVKASNYWSMQRGNSSTLFESQEISRVNVSKTILSSRSITESYEEMNLWAGHLSMYDLIPLNYFLLSYDKFSMLLNLLLNTRDAVER